MDRNKIVINGPRSSARKIILDSFSELLGTKFLEIKDGVIFDEIEASQRGQN